MMIEVNSEFDMKAVGKAVGVLLRGGEIVELIGDIGSGKTTLTKGIVVGLGINEYVQSPSFTVSRIYQGRDQIKLAHYDFYRLDDAGIMANELKEMINDDKTVTVIEWAGIVDNVLPSDRLTIRIVASGENSRVLNLDYGGDISKNILEQIKL